MKAEGEKHELSKYAYGGCSGSEYVPYIPTTEVMPELTGYSIIMGVLFALMFAAANTYLGLKVGITISAGIPGAILATGLLKGIFRRNNILEANMVASLSAMGESIAGGIIFVLPALLLLGFGLSIPTIVIVTIIGGLMGVFFMTAQLPWTLVFIGVAMAAFCFLANLPILAVALGLYLPLGLSAAVFSGGIVRDLVERKMGRTPKARAAAEGKDVVLKWDEEKDKAVEKGILLASGLVAGDALIGIVIGIFAAIGTDIAFGLKLFPAVAESPLLAFVLFLLLGIWVYVYATRKARSR